DASEPRLSGEVPARQPAAVTNLRLVDLLLVLGLVTHRAETEIEAPGVERRHHAAIPDHHRDRPEDERDHQDLPGARRRSLLLDRNHYPARTRLPASHYEHALGIG